ncbi:lamin tail domain-containing protein [Halorubrum sp. CSM-61]|uniref:lamin tail domain-containing protein n=1 Tax=Halorubrum sp. CSM-61 TaxID=2485838 RepID=UPI000F4C6665|nr:lamin tail domain-containing protein [Halorubrum sp. CSM-61]
MSDDTDRAAWQVTTDRERIREWGEEHETVPVLAEGADGADLRLLADPDDERGEELSWDRFFERFESESLALRYRETATRGDGQPAYEFVDRDEIADPNDGGAENPDAPDARTGENDDDDEKQSTPPGTDGTGVTQADSETAVRTDEAAQESETPTADAEPDDPEERDTAMSESSRAVETGAFVLNEIHESRGLGDDVEDEYVTFRNTGEEALDLSGWVVENEAGERFAFPDGFTLDAGQSVTLHSGRGSDTETDVHWGAASGVWDDDGDTITVRTADGREVLREPYLK